MAGQRVRFTAAQADQVVAAAVTSGRIPPWRAGYFRARLAAGGPVGGQAVATLVSLTPAPPDVVASWDRQPRAAADPTHIGDDDEDELYRTLYPTDEQAAAWAERGGREPDRLAQVADRQAYLLSQAAAAGDLADPPPGHGHQVTAEHSHEHSDYAGGTHDHPHVHRGDGRHAPGAGHAHAPAPDPDTAASRGITARRAQRIRVNPADAAAGASEEQLFDRLFGKPPP